MKDKHLYITLIVMKIIALTIVLIISIIAVCNSNGARIFIEYRNVHIEITKPSEDQ